MKGIADTGFLVAFANRNDKHHAWAVSLAETIETPLLTCEAVLAEAAFHLRSVQVVTAMLRDGLVKLAFHMDEHEDGLNGLAARYADQNPDLADLCLVRMSELFAKYTVVTVDASDFRVYRRNKRDVIPFACPPNL